MRCVGFVRCVFALAFLTVCATLAAAEDISGPISATKIIVEDSQLVGNVTCAMTATPCIQFGAPNIALRLNGFTITGPANPDDTTTCPPPGPADGCANHRPRHGAEVQAPRHLHHRNGWRQHQCDGEARHLTPVSAGCWLLA
jgi:hypothetical protein